MLAAEEDVFFSSRFLLARPLLKAINSAEASYAATCGGQYFATVTANLINGGHLDQDLAMPSKSGFTVAIASGAGAVAGTADCLGQPTETAYYASQTEPFAITPVISPIH